MDEYSTAKKFWCGIDNYPDYPHVLLRRLMDTTFIAKRLSAINSIKDLGCGDGSMLLSLREFTEVEEFYGFDLSEKLLTKLRAKWGRWPGLLTITGSILDFDALPYTDATISLGSFPYIFSDKDLEFILDNINSKLLIVRVPCTLKTEDEVINKYSDDLRADYAAVYRTKENYRKLLSNKFKIIEFARAYPDEIESKYGTKHFFYVCESKEN